MFGHVEKLAPLCSRKQELQCNVLLLIRSCTMASETDLAISASQD